MLTLEALRFVRGDFTLSAEWSLEPGARMAILQAETGEKPTIDHPTLDDGVRGVRFIRAASDQGVDGGAWTPSG